MTHHAPARASSGSEPLRYAAVGASDTVGVGADDPVRGAWVALLAGRMAPGTRLYRLGVSGALTRHALACQVPAATSIRPDVATVWLGVNDLNARVPLRTFARQIGTVLRRLSATGAAVVVGTIPDLTKVPAYADIPADELLATVGEWNDAIAEAAAAAGGRVVDLFVPSREAQAGGLVAADGFHPSAEGHRVLAALFWEAVGPVVAQLRDASRPDSSDRFGWGPLEGL